MDILMKQLSSRVSRKTGLPKSECDGIIKVIVYEIVEAILDQGYVEVEGLGTMYKSHSDEIGMIMLTPTQDVYARICAPYKGDRKNEIVFE
jgi:hypothetical protein